MLTPKPRISLWLCLFVFLTALGISGCASVDSENKLPEEIILYNWEGDIPQAILDKFTAETHIKVDFQVYESQEDAIDNMRAGQVFDVVIMESRFIPLLVKDNLLANLNYKNIQNFKYISPSFRGLLYDPDNIYSIPYSWGTTGLLVRTDKVQSPVMKWADLWDARYAGKVAIWKGQPRETLAIALKSLGYSANSENPAELEAALAKLIALKPRLRYVEDYDAESAAPALASGDVFITMAYSGDILASQELGLSIEYILPDEGAVLWGDTFVVPANSPNKTAAELFINFLLRPEISAEIVNQKFYASANETAKVFIDPQILNNPAIYPDNDQIKDAEIILPLSEAGQKLYDRIWQQFLDAGSK